MAIFEIIYRDRDPYNGGRVSKVQADSYTFTSNQEWVEFWGGDGGSQAKLAVKAPEVLSIQRLDDDTENSDGGV